MATNFKKPSKKTAIIATIAIVVLLIVAVTGTVVFLKDRGMTEAAEFQTENVAREGTEATQNNNDNAQETIVQNETDQVQGGEVQTGETSIQNGDDGTQTVGTTDGTNATQTETNGTTGRTNTGETTDEIQETTISRTETVEIPEQKILEGHYVGWTPVSLDIQSVSGNIDAQDNDLDIIKEAYSKDGKKLETVTEGQEVTYQITVKNKSGRDLKAVEIKDIIPEMTTYVKDSADNNAKEILENKKVVGLRWNVDLANGETKVVSFKVTINKGAKGNIENIAVINGEETEKSEMAIITAQKTATIEGKQEGEPAKVGDKVTYTIAITNTGNKAGEAEVKDDSLAQLIEDGILEIDEESKEIAEKLKEGTTVTVPADGTAYVTFKATIKNINGTIKNIATVGEEKPEETIDTVNIEAEKVNDAPETVKPGDEFNYTIKLWNTGSKEGTVKVTDEIPNQLDVISATPPQATINGNNVDFGDVTVTPRTSENAVELTIHVKVKETATGKIENIAKIDDKDDVPDKEIIDIEEKAVITGEKVNLDEDGKVKVGDTIEYQIKLSNSGNVSGKTTVTDTLPLGLTFESASDNGENSGRNITWRDVEVPVGTNKKVLTIKATVNENATGKLINEALVENKPVTDEGVDVVEITASKDSNITDGTYVKEGQEVTYTITAVNNGTVAGDAVITDTLPEGLTYVSATLANQGNDTVKYEDRTVTWEVKDLNKDEQRTLTIKVKVDAINETEKEIFNEVKVDGTPTGNETINVGKPNIVSSKTSRIVSCTSPDQELTEKIVHENDEIEYKITVSNTGKAEKTIDIIDEINDKLSYVEGSLSVEDGNTEVTTAEVDGNTVKLLNYTLEVNHTLTITFKVKVQALEGDVEKDTIAVNIAEVDGTDIPDDKGDYTGKKPIITSSKTSEIKSCSKGEDEGTTIVHEGDTIEYEITVTNSGTDVGNVKVEDLIKDGLTYKAGTATAKVIDTATQKVEIENLPVSVTKNAENKEIISLNYNLQEGKTLIITFEVTVNELVDGDYSKNIGKNVAKINDSQEAEDPNDYNVVKPNIETEKSHRIAECALGVTTGSNVHENDKIEYTITVSNTGGDEGLVTVTDTIKPGLTYVKDSVNAKLNDGTEVEINEPTDGTIKLEGYTLESGKTLTITFEVTVNPLKDGVNKKQIEANVVVVNGDDITDENGGFEVLKPQVESSKTADIQEVEYGEFVNYTITATNITDIEADVEIIDPLPQGIEYVSGTMKINGQEVKVEDEAQYYNAEERKITYNGELANAGDSVVLTFEVRAISIDLGTDIVNTATINGEEKSATIQVVKKVHVTTNKTTIKPIDLVLVLDTSGSMNDDSKLTSLQNSAKQLVNKVFEEETTSTVSMITYSKTAHETTTPYTYATKDDLIEAIGDLSANDGTNIYAALESANNIIPGLGNEREKIVVFLTDGSPTIPNTEYKSGIHSSNNRDDGYKNNLKEPIEEQAIRLKNKVKKVYAIGLGVNKLSDSAVMYAEECTGETLEAIRVNTTFDTENHTFTTTLQNRNNRAVLIKDTGLQFSNIQRLLTVDNEGRINPKNTTSASWSNLEIPANGTITITGTYETRNSNKGPSVEETLDYERFTCTNPQHQEMFNGNPLYSKIKKKDNKQYHCIIEKDYSNYLLSKIASDGVPMNVNNVSEAFDKILKEVSTPTQDFIIRKKGEIFSIEEKDTIISDVTATIGEETKTYKLEDLKNGQDGLKYIEGQGFTWNIGDDDNTLKLNITLQYEVV